MHPVPLSVHAGVTGRDAGAFLSFFVHFVDGCGLFFAPRGERAVVILFFYEPFDPFF